MGEPRWAALYGVAQSRTRLKPLSSSSNTVKIIKNKGEKNLKIWLQQGNPKEDKMCCGTPDGILKQKKGL